MSLGDHSSSEILLARNHTVGMFETAWGCTLKANPALYFQQRSLAWFPYIYFEAAQH